MLTTRTKLRIARSLSTWIRRGRKLCGRSDIADVSRLGVNWRLDLREGIDLALYLNQYERDTLRRYRSLVKAGSTILDIGANIGAYALYLARLTGPLGHVYAVEPTTFALDKLRTNLALNPELASRVTVAQSMLLASPDEALPKTVVSSWPVVGPAMSQSALAGIDRSTEGAQVETLDGLAERWGFNSLDFLKLDVDGHEMSVLRGGIGTLSKYAPSIVMELCPHLHNGTDQSFADLIHLVHDLGYDLFDLSTDQCLPSDPSALERLIPWGAGMNVLMRKEPQRPTPRRERSPL